MIGAQKYILSLLRRLAELRAKLWKTNVSNGTLSVHCMVQISCLKTNSIAFVSQSKLVGKTRKIPNLTNWLSLFVRLTFGNSIRFISCVRANGWQKIGEQELLDRSDHQRHLQCDPLKNDLRLNNMEFQCNRNRENRCSIIYD